MGTNITGIGNANAIGFKSRVTGGMYFPPELKDALVGVWSAYGKSNDSTDRNIIKNKIKDRGGDFELINFNYEGTSGYNGYPVVFGKDKTYQYVNHSPNYNQTTINVTHFNTRQALLYSYIQRNGELTSYNRDYPSYKIKVSGLEEGFGLMYQYNSKADATSVNALRIETNGIYTIPKSFASDGSLTNANIWVGFVFTGTEQEQCNVTIEVLPEYKGAVVTDGVNDMIVSQNTVEEMGITDEFTVVSMIHQITLRGATAAALTNYIRQPIGHEYVRNHVANIGKTGIYGYAVYDVNHSSAGNSHIINTILGDKNDYSIHITGNLSQGKFSVQGYINGDNNAVELSQVAWYWTFIANKLLTEDEINLIIEKYNLDRPGEIVKPDVYYDIKRQKITNENHSSFDDELTDFSGNGHNMKLYNIAWEGNSGIGNYPVVFGANKTWKNLRAEDNNLSYKLIANSITVYKVLPNSGAIMWTYIKENEIIREIEIPSFTVKVSGTKNGDRVRYYYVDENSTFKNTIFDITEDGTYVLPKCNKLQITESTPSTNIFIGFVIILNDNPSTGVTIEVIPSNENAICLDGVDDYGKVTGLPIYKDYTVAALRKWLYDDSVTSTQTGSIVSKSKFGSDGAFIFEQTLNKNPSRSSTWCFGLTNSLINNDKLFEESFTYQTKYSYNNNPIQPGTGFDRDSMWLGSVRDNDSRYSKMAIWSLLLFPYSLSEFLLERQIKKARAGTLYPNQVEFRPIIPEDENITRIDYFVVNSGTWIVIKPGDYVDVGARIVLNVYTKLPYKIEKVSSPAFTGMSVRHSTELNIFDVEGYIKDKTPQKIKLTLAINKDIVQWNPAITSNLLDSFTVSSWYLNGWDNTLTAGTWIKKTDRVFFKATFKTELYGLETATFGGTECVVSKADNWSDSKNIWDIRMLGTVGDLSQVFNLDVYELIRFEDIVQPYPVLLRFKDENGNEVSWGGKFRVGSSITRIGSFYDCNLLKGIYTVSNAKLNGSPLPSTPHVVERQMVFTCTATYLLDDNEPKCILSPSRLRIPNSSYKLLGYIPDISGHGNNGVIHNSAYAEGSGVNEDGSYQFDGVDDFVAIPTLSSGGKQVLMKVNLPKLNEIIYDQRKEQNTYTFAILTTPSQIAYDQRNSERITYIDGILNTNIIAEQLMGVTHNIVVINSKANLDNTRSPILGRDINGNNWSRMRIYDFMLFDNISTDDKIKELNEYIGLSGNIFEFNPPTFTIDLPMAIKNIKVYQGGNEISPGYLYPNKDTEFEVYVSLNDGKYAVDTITVDGVEITKDRVVGEYNIFKFILNGSSEQKIKIHSYEYIMYEDINQPYPVIFKVKDRTTNQIYSWGDRIKIGSSIQLIHGENPNLLPELYSIISYTYEGNSYSYNQLTNLVITVTKTISVSCQKTWKLGSNEPKCILSPKRLKLANSSYKYLGYIPDISGNGNNGVFNNFEFAGMSGANGYPYDYNNSSFLCDSNLAKVVSGELIEYFAVKNSVGFFNITSGVYKGEIKVTGVTKAISENKISQLIIYTNSTTDNELIDITQDGNYNIDIKGVDDANRVFFYAIPSNPNDTAVVRLTEPIYIEQVGNYEGSICFDGVDDYMDIPSLSIGGKQVLMKTNWLKSPTLLYDQRASGSFAILTTKEDDATNPRIAYQARNQDGKTYIDGIENNYIETYSLKGITHNITVTNPSAGSGVVPVIGANTGKSSGFAKMALYDFMLFDEVSTDEEIKQLNDIVGIEGGYVQKPPYYWDAYGKTNSDADRDTIQQRGVAVGNYDLTNYNHAYDKMSGYGGYSLGRFDKSWSSSNNTSVIVVSRNPYDITLKKLGGNSDWEFNNTELKVISNPVSVKFKSNKNIRVTCDYHYYPVGGNSEGTPLGITSKDLIANKDAIITISPISQENIDKYNIDVNRGYYLIYFQLSSTLAVNEEVTIEMLPLYPNGLVYDGVDDYSENASIPLLSDYTYIFKRTLLNKKYNSASIFKGSNKQSGGGAFICDYNSVEPDLLTQGFSFGAGLYVDSLNADSIVYGTRGSVNGTKITAGNNTDTEGLTVGKWRAYKEMVFYKLFLYPRTVNMLSINMVKNMMEEDGIIDLTSKLFTDKYTGDFYEMDFNNDFLIGN